jgi:pyridoxine/pyridoxamine 5'-phosphate oxidase
MSKDPMTRAEFVEFVRAAKLGVVATVDAEGRPEAALVDLAVTDQGEVLFDTMAAARKVINIGDNERVALVVGWADKVSVQAEGDAEVLSGAEREKYGRIHQEQVPTSRAFREDFTLVKMVPMWLRYFDARPESFGIVETPLL